MKNLKKLILLICVLGMSNAYSIGKNNKIKDARRMMQEGSLNADETCLDEYLFAQQQYKRMLAFGALRRGAVISGSGAVSAGTIVGGASLAYGSGAAGAAVAAGSVLGAGATVGAIVAAPIVVATATFSTTKLLQTNYMIKVLRDAYKGRGSSLNKFTKKFLRRNKDARGYMTREEMRQIVLDLDQSGALCDGSMRKQRRIHKVRVPKQRHQLAMKKHIYKYIKNTL